MAMEWFLSDFRHVINSIIFEKRYGHIMGFAGMWHGTRRRIHTVIKIAHQCVQICMPVLLVHRHVDDGIQTGREINEDVAYRVYHRILHVRVEYFHQCYRQIADQETEEDEKNHFCHVHLAAFDVAAALVLLHPFPALPDYPVDPRVTNYDDNAGQGETQHE